MLKCIHMKIVKPISMYSLIQHLGEEQKSVPSVVRESFIEEVVVVSDLFGHLTLVWLKSYDV